MMTENVQILSLGQQLRTARDALEISLADVAQKTNLKKSHLESLENDIFILPNIPSPFVRGYVRSYLRFLRLPVDLADSIDYGDSQRAQNAKGAILSSSPIKHNDRTQIRWVKALTWLILLVAIGMTLVWWWQEHKKDQESSQQLIGQVLQQTQDNEYTEINHSDLAVNTPITISPVAQESQAAVSSSLEDREQVVVEEIAKDISSDGQSQSILQDASTNVLRQVTTESAVELQPEQTQHVVKDELYIEISGANSWISVRDSTNKKLAEKLYNTGEVLSFNGNEQYRLVIGAPANVKIYYKGELVPLKLDGRVARFKLPLAN